MSLKTVWRFSHSFLQFEFITLQWEDAPQMSIYHPSIILTAFPRKGLRGAGTSPSCHWVRGGVHPGPWLTLWQDTIQLSTFRGCFALGTKMSSNCPDYRWCKNAQHYAILITTAVVDLGYKKVYQPAEEYRTAFVEERACFPEAKNNIE